VVLRRETAPPWIFMGRDDAMHGGVDVA